MTNALQRSKDAADILLAVRAGGVPPSDFPEAIRPHTREDAYSIQAVVAPSLGPIGGWKVGSPTPDDEPMCSPLPFAGILRSPGQVPGPLAYRGVETEIDFRMAASLPLRDKPYERCEVLDAIGSCHAAIEIVECRFAQMDDASHLSSLADLQNHHALIVGGQNLDWRAIAFDKLSVQVDLGDGRTIQKTGGNPAGDPINLLIWLANVGARWAGGLRAGDIVTTGSWIGKIPAQPHAWITSTFEGFPPVQAHLSG